MSQFTHWSGEGGWGAARADRTPAPRDGDWAVEHESGDPARLHALGLPEPVVRTLRWCDADRDALVIGSAQPVPPEPHELPIVRRRSGGAGVIVGPGRLVWLDVAIPADDPLWDDDVGVAPLWLGEVWAVALGHAASVHRGPMVRTPRSATVCFAGVGPGEVLVGGRKIVGISQRRTAAGALFQCACLLTYDGPDAAVGLDRVAPGLDVEGAFTEALYGRRR